MTAPALRLAHISKRFGALLANDDISVELRRGEVLALLGENGAGKSTLVSILFGHYTADSGSVEVAGRPLAPGQPKAALAAGIGMVHQHFTLADNLSVLDNVMLGTEPLWRPWSRREAARQQLLATAERFGLAVRPEALVASLSVGERQRVEILKALVRGARILILDEPTAVLTPQESLALFATLTQMVAQGLAIIFISHKLDEVMRVSQRIAVLRGGRLVALENTAQTSAAALALAMVGHAVQMPSRRARQVPSAERVVCELLDVHTTALGRERLRGASLQLVAGEIVAVAGVSGNGQSALAAVLHGTLGITAGQLLLAGRAMPAEPSAWVGAGVARVPEDRQAEGAVGDLPLWQNAVSERLRGEPFSCALWGPLRWLRRGPAQAHAQHIVQRFDVRGGSLGGAVRALSGGNLQKLILGRALLAPDGSTARLIVVHQPTWGLDVGAVAFIHEQLIAACDAGAAVLVISDDLDEVLALGDRVAVMHAGRLTPALPGEAWSREALGLAMAGAAAGGGEVRHAA